jgi:hypothetical protein
MEQKTGLLALVPIWLIAIPMAGAQDADPRIAEAVRPLPAELREDATVFSYDETTGERIVLRQGRNAVECLPKNPNTGFTRCYAVADSSRRDLMAKLAAEGKSPEETDAALVEAEAAGEIPPATFGGLRYRVYDDDDRIRFLWVVSLPNATSGQLGMSTASQRDSSLAGRGLPWMMREGTPQAHLMIPINGTELSNPGGAASRMNTKAIDDPLERATLPLPEDLRAGATVVRYDLTTGAREVLRQGTNEMECQDSSAVSRFIRCYLKSFGAEQDLRVRLMVEGKSGDEITAAVDAARAAGELEPVPFGSLQYRVYEDDDRLKLLWVLRLPNASSEQLGMPTASQRDSSLAGRGLPWMMLEGTPEAHLMIPINSTELSN